MRWFKDNDGNEVQTFNVSPRDLHPGDRLPRIIEVGPFGKYIEEVVESSEKLARNHDRQTLYRIVLVAPDNTRRTAHVLAQARIEIKERS